MTHEDKPTRIDDDDARGATTNTGLRYVLGFSLLFAVVAMSAVWIIPALWG